MDSGECKPDGFGLKRELRGPGWPAPDTHSGILIRGGRSFSTGLGQNCGLSSERKG